PRSSMLTPHPQSALFPYTTLFRSRLRKPRQLRLDRASIMWDRALPGNDFPRRTRLCLGRIGGKLFVGRAHSQAEPIPRQSLVLLVFAGAAEAAFTPFGLGGEGVDVVQVELEDGLEHELSDAFARFDGVGLLAVVGKNDADFAMVVG